MGAITCFGEALIDFLNTGTRQEGLIGIPEFRQFPGGAPANVAVAIARLGGDARFAGQVGSDTFGRFIATSLEAYGVNTDHLTLHPAAKTALAFVFLDPDGERSFEFHRDATADLLLTSAEVKDSWFSDSDIFHFCSNTLTDDQIATTTLTALRKARAAGCITSFDVNLRHNLWPDGKADAKRVLDCFHLVDLIKVSREELDYLSPAGEQAFIELVTSEQVSTILITDGGAPIRVCTKSGYSDVVPPATQVVDTTAAGDAFTGGFLFALANRNDIRAALNNLHEIEEMAKFASRCGAYTVARQGAFTALPTLEALNLDN